MRKKRRNKSNFFSPSQGELEGVNFYISPDQKRRLGLNSNPQCLLRSEGEDCDPRFFYAKKIIFCKKFITLWKTEEGEKRIVKTRLMVRSLKGSTMTRIVFTFLQKEDSIEFIEIFLKNKKEREDFKKIEKYKNIISPLKINP